MRSRIFKDNEIVFQEHDKICPARRTSFFRRKIDTCTCSKQQKYKEQFHLRRVKFQHTFESTMNTFKIFCIDEIAPIKIEQYKKLLYHIGENCGKIIFVESVESTTKKLDKLI